jgi:plasmid maintenance system antidote protein VapI
MIPIHPGEILLEDFLIPMEISQYKLTKELHVSPIRKLFEGNDQSLQMPQSG